MKNLWSKIGTRFVAVGIVNTFTDFAILNFLVYAFNANKIVANTISATIAMTVSYILNYHIVFRQKSANHFKRAALFLIITAFGLWILQNLIIYILIHWFTWPGEVIKSLANIIGLESITKDFAILNTAKVIGTVVSLLWNFFMYKKFVFTDKIGSGNQSIVNNKQ